jgi:glycosyltransferase involved in cell wall biosynthesis
LSCKRPAELRRLCDSLVPFFRDVETYDRLELILVDNGSGEQLVGEVRELGFFDHVIAHPTNLGMARALNDVYQRCRGEFVLLIEDDMVVESDAPFIGRCVEVLREFPEIGLVRLKNQNNWWKPFRVISPLRETSGGVAFWTWLPSRDRRWNVWACGSVLFRRASFTSTGPLPAGEGRKQASLVEEEYGRIYNRTWLAAKLVDCYPVLQPNDNPESPGFQDKLL